MVFTCSMLPNMHGCMRLLKQVTGNMIHVGREERMVACGVLQFGVTKIHVNEQ